MDGKLLVSQQVVDLGALAEEACFRFAGAFLFNFRIVNHNLNYN
jgi:hypothetical protein